MGIIIFNSVGLIILVVSFLIAFLTGHTFGFSGEGPLMIVAGVLAFAADVVYRLKNGQGRWFYPNAGGMLFFMPIWMFGLLWVVLGIVYATGNG